MPEIEHQADRNRFTFATEGEQAVLEYRLLRSSDALSEPDKIDFTYTYVPPAYRGRGLAEALVRHGLKWARQKNYQISASCWYVAKFLH